MATKGVPEGYTTVTPYLCVRGATKAIEFYKNAFGATERSRMPGPDGERLMHAEIEIGGSVVMLSDEWPEFGGASKSPQTLGGTTQVLHIYSSDVDAAYKQAVQAGAESLMKPEDMFWGDRYCQVRDPFGHVWGLLTQKEKLTQEQMAERASSFFAGGAR